MSNDTGRTDLDEHGESRLSWPAEMMRIPAKPPPSRRTQISSIHSRLAPASHAAAEDGISSTVITQPLKQGSRGANNPLPALPFIPTTAPSFLAPAPPTEMAGDSTLIFLNPEWKRIRKTEQPGSVV